MSQPIYWIAVDFDHVPTGEEMKQFADSLSEDFEHDAIITTKEVEPMNKDDVKEYLNEIQEALE